MIGIIESDNVGECKRMLEEMSYSPKHIVEYIVAADSHSSHNCLDILLDYAGNHCAFEVAKLLKDEQLAVEVIAAFQMSRALTHDELLSTMRLEEVPNDLINLLV